MPGREHDEAVPSAPPPAPVPAPAVEARPRRLDPRTALALQRSAGNHAVARMLARAPDPNAPAPVIDQPQEDAYVQTDTYSIRVNPHGPTNNVQVRVDTGGWNQARQADGAWWWDWSNFPPGRREITAKAWNEAGLSTETPVRHAVLTAAPPNAVNAAYSGAQFVSLTSYLPRLDGPKTAEMTQLLAPWMPQRQLLLLRALHDGGQTAVATYNAVKAANGLAGTYLQNIPIPVIRMLPAEFFAALDAAQLAQLTHQQLGALSMPALHALDNAALAGLGGPHLQSLSERQVAGLMPRLPVALIQHLPVGGAMVGANSLGTALGAGPAVVGLPIDRRLSPGAVLGLAGGPAPSPAELSEFTSAHVAAMPAGLMALLQPQHVGALPPAQLPQLPIPSFNALRVQPAFAALAGDQVRNLTAAQVGALTAAELTPAQLGAMTPVQIGQLTAPCFAAFSDEQLQRLAPAQLAALTVAQLNQLAEPRFAAFLPAQARWLPPHLLNQLTQDRFDRLTATHGPALRQEQSGAAPNAAAGPHNLPAMPNLGTFPVADVPEAPVSQLRQLTAPQVQQFTDAQIRAMSGAQLAALAPAGIALWAGAQLTAIAGRMQYLTSEQTAALALIQLVPGDLARLHPEQLLAQGGGAVGGVSANLTPEQLGGLLPAQIATVLPNLNPAQVPHITSGQLAGVPAATLQVLPPPRLQAITQPQFSALNAEHLNALVTNQLDNLTVPQFGWLAARLHAADVLPGAAPAGAGAPGHGVRAIDPALLAALPPALQTRIPPLPGGGGVQSRLETLRSVLPDRRGRIVSRSVVPAAPAPLGWPHLFAQLNGLDPAFALDPVDVLANATEQARALSALFTLPVLTIAVAVRNTLVAQGRNSLHPWFAQAPHNNWGTPLPGPNNGPPAVANRNPYEEFDIFPNTQGLVNIQGNPAVNPGRTNRGMHRIVFGIQPAAGPHAHPAPPHAGVGHWFYTGDHYRTFVEI